MQYYLLFVFYINCKIHIYFNVINHNQQCSWPHGLVSYYLRDAARVELAWVELEQKTHKKSCEEEEEEEDFYQ